MKKNLIVIVVALLITGYFTGCKKKEDLNTPLVGLGGDTWVKGPLDDWISTNYTTPYNMEIKYKWDRSELGEINKDVVPILESKVIPVLETIKSGWIDPYVAIKGGDFFKKYVQKQIYMVGSAQYNSNGSITLGVAESGRKVTLMVLNDFQKGNRSSVERILHTMHHEFGHILNQNIAVTSDYQRITAGSYSATWFNIAEEDANSMGFISSYAMASKDEDFVEMLSIMLVDGEDRFQALLATLEPDAQAKLLKKKSIVISYLKSAFGIDFIALQNKVQAEINTMAPLKK